MTALTKRTAKILVGDFIWMQKTIGIVFSFKVRLMLLVVLSEEINTLKDLTDVHV